MEYLRKQKAIDFPKAEKPAPPMKKLAAFGTGSTYPPRTAKILFGSG
jgi:hypothetical protein